MVVRRMRWVFDVIMWSLLTRIEKSYSISYSNLIEARVVSLR